MQGRLLLRPSPELTEIILGIIGKAQDMYGMAIHAFVVLSTHAHFLLSPAHTGERDQSDRFIMISRSEATLAGCGRDITRSAAPCQGAFWKDP